MSRVIVGRWGKNLAVRVPRDIATRAGLSDGEAVEIETQDGNILIRRSSISPAQRADALAAAREIIADARRFSLSGLSVRDLRDEGRPG